MENQSQQSPDIFSSNQQQALPNATAVLVLGIISIVGSCCYGVVGLICAIIAIVLSRKDMMSYKMEPLRYTAASYSNLKAGRICAIVGISLSAIYLLFIIFIIATVGLAALSHPDQWMRH